MSTPNEDIPNSNGCVRLARGEFPNLAWAIDELPLRSSIDEVCVELEVITGQPAIVTRDALLRRISWYIDSRPIRDTVAWIAEYSPRLAIWAGLGISLTRDKRFVPSLVREMKEHLDAWCHGRVDLDPVGRRLREQWGDVDDAYDRRSRDDAESMGELLHAARVAEYTSYNERITAISIGLENCADLIIPRFDPWTSDYQDMQRFYRDAVVKSIMAFPANERAR